MKNLKAMCLMSVLIGLGVLTRTIFHLGPNVEFVTASSLAAGYFVENKKLALLVPLLILLISDVIIGNTIIYLFTWSAFFVTVSLGILLSSKKTQKFIKINNTFLKTGLIGEGMGIISTLIFYFWTNFGVVVTTSMYQKNLVGLMQSYTNAFPFLINQLVGNLIIVPLIFVGLSIVLDRKYSKKYKLKLINHVN